MHSSLETVLQQNLSCTGQIKKIKTLWKTYMQQYKIKQIRWIQKNNPFYEPSFSYNDKIHKYKTTTVKSSISLKL